MKVLIAVDETETSVRAATAAHRLFGSDADYLAINVSRPVLPWLDTMYGWGSSWSLGPGWVPGTPPAPGGAAEVETTDVERSAAGDTAERVLDDADLGTEGEALGAVGDPVDVIVRAAHAHGADVIVVGAGERDWFSRLFSRSVSTNVIASSPVPVLVVR